MNRPSSNNSNMSSVTENNSDEEDTEEQKQNSVSQSKRRTRDIVAFWFFGLCNNFGYVIMLSAADDIISSLESIPETNVTTTVLLLKSTQTPFNLTTPDTAQTFHCNKISTGAVLLADILPGFIIKLIAPIFITAVPYWSRITLCVLMSFASFLLVAFSTAIHTSIIGVSLASFSSGLGELTFLGLTSYYSSNTVSAWSSGTGAAGVFGALLYAGLRSAGLTAKTTLLINLVIPVLETVMYVGLHVQPTAVDLDDDNKSLLHSNSSVRSVPQLTGKSKLHILKSSLTLMAALCLVYLAEYIINQGLFEILYFDNISVTFLSSYGAQYRWYQVLYQVGVMISRSSVNLIHIKQTWIFTVLQFINLTVLLCQAIYQFIPYIWIVFILILWEGCMGGAAYVNTFYRITVEEEDDKKREYAMTLVTISDAGGIVMAAFTAMALHNTICSYLHYF